jgi:hypothetical protein
MPAQQAQALFEPPCGACRRSRLAIHAVRWAAVVSVPAAISTSTQ